MSGRVTLPSVTAVSCSTKSQCSTMPAISTTRRSCISPQRPRIWGAWRAVTRLWVSLRRPSPEVRNAVTCSSRPWYAPTRSFSICPSWSRYWASRVAIGSTVPLRRASRTSRSLRSAWAAWSKRSPASSARRSVPVSTILAETCSMVALSAARSSTRRASASLARASATASSAVIADRRRTAASPASAAPSTTPRSRPARRASTTMVPPLPPSPRGRDGAERSDHRTLRMTCDMRRTPTGMGTVASDHGHASTVDRPPHVGAERR